MANELRAETIIVRTGSLPTISEDGFFGATQAGVPAAYVRLGSVWRQLAGAGPGLLDQYPSPAGPAFFNAANLTTTQGLNSTQTFAFYLGRSRLASAASVTLRYRVTGGLSFTTWAELAIATGTHGFGGSNVLTTRGYVDASSIWNSTGVKSTAVNVSGVIGGDHLWALFGNQAGGVAVFRAGLADDLGGGFVSAQVARPSTMGAGTSFTVSSTIPHFWVEWREA